MSRLYHLLSILVIPATLVLASCTLPAKVSRVRLTIQGAPATTADYQVVFGTLATSITAPLVDLVVPDSDANVSTAVQAWGVDSSGAFVAYGTTMVTPVLGSTVDAMVALAPISCPTMCTVGDSVCSGTGLATCTLGADGCPEPSPATPCAAPAHGTATCSNATCGFACNVSYEAAGASCERMAGTGSDVDVLFVIDNSASTGDKQIALAANLSAFVTALGTLPAPGGGTALPNLHIGVVSTTVDIGVDGVSGCPHPDPTDNGLLQTTARVAGCTPPTAASYISDLAAPGGTRTRNYTGSLDSEIACLAQLGSTGCGFEAPLAAIQRALDGTTNPQNAGFLRPEADLAVIILTDEDDASVSDPTVFSLPASTSGPADFRLQPLFAYTCSTAISATNPGTYDDCKINRTSYLTDPQATAAFLATIKDPAHTVVGLIAGPPQPTNAPSDLLPQIATGSLTILGSTQALALLPSCQATINGNPAIARPGIRLVDFLSGFDARGVFGTACTDDYSATLTAVATEIVSTLPAP